MCMFCTYRGVYSKGVDEIGWGATTRSLPDLIASMHLRFAALLTAWTNAGCRNVSKLLRSITWWREFIVMRGFLWGGGIIWKWTQLAFLPAFIVPVGVNHQTLKMTNDRMSHADRARRWAMCQKIVWSACCADYSNDKKSGMTRSWWRSQTWQYKLLLRMAD